ncbi:MAG TPA: type II secretion system F family protein [Gemmatimonadaceae bacterium]|nr:type II secretion system F family protein [Gemmatimonadaceae bacterium]
MTTAGVSYRYRAARANGVLEVGVVQAESREGAVAELTTRGLFPVDVALERERVPLAASLFGASRGRLSAADLALGLRVLATLLEAGLPMARALSSLQELVPKSWQSALPELERAVREGKSLAAALASSPLGVPPVVIGMIQAGEAGSGVAQAVARAAELTEETAATRAAVRSALTYPVILALAGLGSLVLLVGVVLPRFAVILADLGQGLPPTTRIVLQASAVMRAGALPAALALALGIVAHRAWVGTDAGRVRWHELLLAAPVIGAVRRSAATARTLAALAALLESGVPVAPATMHAARASGDAALAARLRSAREAVMAGERLSRACAAREALTATAVRLIRAGEETGRLAGMCAHAARLESARAREQVSRAVKLLEPALIVGFGGIVAVVAAALLQAMYSVRPG